MEGLHAYFSRLQSTLAPDGPGFSSLVVLDGRVAHEMHHGLASIELGVALSGKSAFYMASESKQFTAASMFSLMRTGAIALDDDVVRWLPELANFEQAFTLRTLLNHTSGIPDYFQFIECQPGRHEADYFNNTSILRIIACMYSVAFPTGSRYGYSNSNYILLATLVERLSGKPLALYARETLFAPLGADMRFDEDRFSVIPHRVCSYEVDLARPLGFKQHLGNANTVGDGGLVASTDALCLWERHWHAQWRDPGSIVHAMLEPSPLPDGSVPPYRFGLELTQRHGVDIVFHGGGLWGFATMILRIPARAMSVIVLANCDLAEPDLEELIEAALV